MLVFYFLTISIDTRIVNICYFFFKANGISIRSIKKKSWAIIFLIYSYMHFHQNRGFLSCKAIGWVYFYTQSKIKVLEKATK